MNTRLENPPFYPQWGRSCSDAHLTPGVKNNAGYPDFILYINPQQRLHAAIMEVKTWWSYSEDDFEMIFSDIAAQSVTGAFEWKAKEGICVLLKQVSLRLGSCSILCEFIRFTFFF